MGARARAAIGQAGRSRPRSCKSAREPRQRLCLSAATYWRKEFLFQASNGGVGARPTVTEVEHATSTHKLGPVRPRYDEGINQLSRRSIVRACKLHFTSLPCLTFVRCPLPPTPAFGSASTCCVFRGAWAAAFSAGSCSAEAPTRSCGAGKRSQEAQVRKRSQKRKSVRFFSFYVAPAAAVGRSRGGSLRRAAVPLDTRATDAREKWLHPTASTRRPHLQAPPPLAPAAPRRAAVAARAARPRRDRGARARSRER